MKNYLFLLLIPLMSFGQEITFDELMTISSTDSFKRVVIENGFEFNEDKDDFIWYGYKVTKKKSGESAKKWAIYNEEYGLSIFQFFKDGIWVELEYNQIVSEIKSNCEYVEIDGDYATYNCSESSFKGTIGIMNANGTGYVRIKPSIE